MASAGHLVTVTDERYASVIVHRHHLLLPIVIHRSSARTGVITPAEGNNTVAVAHLYLLRAAAVTSQRIVHLAAAAPPSSVMRSRSVTIVRHHHLLFIIIIPRAPHHQRSGSYGLIRLNPGSSFFMGAQPSRRRWCAVTTAAWLRLSLVSRVLFPALKRRGPGTKRGWGDGPLRLLRLLARLGWLSFSLVVSVLPKTTK